MALISNDDQLGLIENFTSDLEASLGVARRTISFEALWDSAPPVEADGQSLQEYMRYVSLWISNQRDPGSHI